MTTPFYELRGGRNFVVSLREAIEQAKKEGPLELRVDGGGLVCIVRPDSKVVDLVEEYERRDRESVERYRASPAYAASEKAKAENLRNMQKLYDGLWARFDKLDFSNYTALMEWLCDLEESAETPGVNKSHNGREIVNVFRRHGYERLDYEGLSDREIPWEDQEACARHMIGYALEGLDYRFALAPKRIRPQFGHWRKLYGS